MNRKTVFVTGASSGFGEAIARKFAENKWRVIINARRIERLEKLSTELEKEFQAEVFELGFDVRDRKAVEAAINTLPSNWQRIDLLVNNAGLAAGKDLFEDADIEDWDQMIDTNVKGLLYVTKALLPNLLRSDSAHIINIGSTAGKETYRRGSVYCASKQAVNAISEAMRIDLLEKGVKVTQICPGLAETEFSLVRFKGNTDIAQKVYEGYEPLHAEDIADIAWFAANQPKHVCLNDIVVTCTAQANSFYTHKSND